MTDSARPFDPYATRDAERPPARRSRRRRRHRPDRDRGRLLGRAGEARCPSFFPGHQAGSSHHHVKHGIAAFLVGLACFVFAWFRTGPKRKTAARVILAALITYPQAIILGLLQGVSELFPVSSLGHSVILPSLLGWNIHQNDKYFLTFLVATHLATAIVLLGFFWRDWVRIVKGLGRSLRDRGIVRRRSRRQARLAARRRHDPGGHPRAAAQDTLRKVFASPTSAAIFLIAQRRAALRRRAAAPARARHRGRRRRPDRPAVSLARRRSSSAQRRRSR